MELEKFEEIRNSFCSVHEDVTEGKMMSSPGIHYKNKVFAFFSRKNKMVFKLGKTYPVNQSNFEISQFNPFKNKGPLRGWFEVDYKNKNQWEELTSKALDFIKGKQ